MKPTLVILAAGMGSRYGGLKQLDEVGPNGEAIIDYSLYDAIEAGFGKVVFIIRRDFEQAFKERFDEKLKGKIEVEYAYQALTDLPQGFSVPEGREKPWGTAHAIRSARNLVNTPFAAINADDFYGKEAYQALANFLTSAVSESSYCMVGYRLNKTLSDHGSVARGICKTDESSYLIDIDELTQIEKDGDSIIYTKENQTFNLAGEALVSMNIWGFHPSLFSNLEKGFVDFLEKQGNELKSEFYIPLHVGNVVKKGLATVKVLSSPASWFGVTYQQDKPIVQQKIRELTAQGQYPAKLW